MAQRPSTYRVYVHDYTSFQSLTNVRLPDQVELQIVLEFARENLSPPGTFQADWDSGINRRVITDFKRVHPRSKFFVSIGGPQPYLVTPTTRDEWIANANDTLGRIISDYDLDGLDVYYAQFNNGADEGALRQVLAGLAERATNPAIISLVAATPGLNQKYIPWFEAARNNAENGTVLYQHPARP